MPIRMTPNGSETEQRISQNLPVNQTPSDSGLLHSDNWIDEVGPQYKKAPNEKIISKNGAFVVLGTDRPDSQASGYGALGSSRAATIDLVVGRMASARGGEGPSQGTFVDNSFAADAARVYISQQTDIDKNFGIVEGYVGNSTGRSAIGMKADGIRLFGREGIKIVTGKGNNWRGFGNSGETNSLGGKISQPAPGIDLIAGNNVEPRELSGGQIIETLQPVVMGLNTVDAFKDLQAVIEEFIGLMQNYVRLQSTINRATSVALASSGKNPVHAASAATIETANSIGIPTLVSNPLHHTRVNLTYEFEMNYLYPFSYKYICSRSVRTT
jgi:hypothetical protein